MGSRSLPLFKREVKMARRRKAPFPKLKAEDALAALRDCDEPVRFVWGPA
jgi:hypothetical protein